MEASAHPHALARIFVRPIASGLPLGFLAFGMGMFMLGVLGLELVPATDARNAALVLVLFVFPLELVATVIAFLARDTMGATALGLFTTSWLTFGLAVLLAKPGATSESLGYYEVFFTVAVLAIASIAWLGKPLLAAIMSVAAVRAALAAVYQFNGSTTANHVSGVLGFVISGLAVYGALAFMLEDVRGEAVLPIFRRGAARQAIEGSLADQLANLEAEAGVRQQL